MFSICNFPELFKTVTCGEKLGILWKNRFDLMYVLVFSNIFVMNVIRFCSNAAD